MDIKKKNLFLEKKMSWKYYGICLTNVLDNVNSMSSSIIKSVKLLLFYRYVIP